MINIQNGEIILENLSYTIGFSINRKKFEETFPKEFIRNINDVHNGYMWFYVWGSIIGKDDILLLALCFNPDNEIDSISIYPHVNHNIKSDWSNWSEIKFAKEKTFCDNWLKNNFNLKEHNVFSWGTLASYSDERAGSNGIVVRYNRYIK